MDSKGNTRPIFSILKEMQASFEKNNLGTGQRSEYMKAIFGEEASSSASVLMAAAASGKLDNLTRLIKALTAKLKSWSRSCRTISAATLKSFSQPMRRSELTFMTSKRSRFASSPRRPQNTCYSSMAGYKIKGLLRPSALSPVALGLIAVIGGIGLIAWPVIAGINAIIAAAGLLGAVFTTISGGVIAAIGAITWPVVAVAAAVVAGALLIRKYWEPVSAFSVVLSRG